MFGIASSLLGADTLPDVSTALTTNVLVPTKVAYAIVDV